MTSVVEKRWIAVKGNTTIEEADTKKELLSKLDTDECPECGNVIAQYDIVAVPKSHESTFI